MDISSSTRELFVLGMISRRPMYGHEIMQTLKLSNARLWIEISDKHVYHVLRKLERHEFVRSTEERVERRPTRRRYEITTAGQAAFTAMIADKTHQHALAYSPFDTVVAMLAWGDVSGDLAIRLLRERRDVLSERYERESRTNIKEIETSFGRIPRAMNQKSRLLLDAELRWLDALIEEVDQVGWENMRINSNVIRTNRQDEEV